MRGYFSPELTEYGDIAALTGFFGGSNLDDVLVDENGDVIENGEGEYDGCVVEGGCLP